jgi:secreted trypsin-like serine protease
VCDFDLLGCLRLSAIVVVFGSSYSTSLVGFEANGSVRMTHVFAFDLTVWPVCRADLCGSKVTTNWYLQRLLCLLRYELGPAKVKKSFEVLLRREAPGCWTHAHAVLLQAAPQRRRLKISEGSDPISSRVPQCPGTRLPR